MSKPVKIGVMGAGRGSTMMRYCMMNPDAELTAICDRNEELLSRKKKEFGKKGANIRYFTDFDKFLAEADVDAVVLANFANDHAPYAVKCMEAGKHVLSEVLPVETLKEAVALCECVERTGKIYAYAENYCYFASTREMKRLFDNGTLGDFEYGEGEYVHDCQHGWPGLTHGADPTHWRNVMSAFYYCTHSAGPLVHMVRSKGVRPVRVVGVEGPYNQRAKDMTACGSAFAVEMVTLSNGGVFKSIHGLSLAGNSIWYNAYGTNGRAESAREYAGTVLGGGPLHRLYVNYDADEYNAFKRKHAYFPGMDKRAKKFGHSGSDWYIMNNFCKKINGEEADTVDVYEALDMYFVGHFGFLSALEGKPMDIPDFRNKWEREQFRNDTRCPDPKKAGEQLIPCNTHGGLDFNPERQKYLEEEWKHPRKVGKIKSMLFEMRKYTNRGRIK